MTQLVKCTSVICKKDLKKNFVLFDIMKFKYQSDFFNLPMYDINKSMLKCRKYKCKENRIFFKALQNTFFSENRYRVLIPYKDNYGDSKQYDYIFRPLLDVLGELSHRFLQTTEQEYYSYTSRIDFVRFKIVRYEINQAVISYLIQSKKYLEVKDNFKFLLELDRLDNPNSVSLPEYVDKWVSELKEIPWDFKMTRHEKAGRGLGGLK